MQPAWRQGGAGLDRAARCEREAVSGEDWRRAGAVGGNHIAAGAAGAYACDDRADGLPAAAAVSIWRDGTVGAGSENCFGQSAAVVMSKEVQGLSHSTGAG